MCSSCPVSLLKELNQVQLQEKALQNNSAIASNAQGMSDKELISQQNRCNLIKVEVEIHNSCHFDDRFEPRVSSSLKSVHGQSTCEDPGLKRTESDITILSNPSQSSILVVANVGAELELSLDAISENSLDCHR